MYVYVYIHTHTHQDPAKRGTESLVVKRVPTSLEDRFIFKQAEEIAGVRQIHAYMHIQRENDLYYATNRNCTITDEFLRKTIFPHTRVARGVCV